jgi:hypothetical protein
MAAFGSFATAPTARKTEQARNTVDPATASLSSKLSRDPARIASASGLV